MYSTLSREKFRILLAGRHYLDTFYYGFNYSMFHYAGQQGAPIENVVDLQLLNPCVGVRFNAFFDFDIKLGALLTAQRDRSFGHSWEKPCMGEFAFRISRWGLSLDERLYVGDNIHPFFYGHELEDGTPLPYGRELYPAESFFRTDQKVYSRTALSYRRSFFDDTVSVRAEFAAHHDGTALGTQQMLVVGVKLLKTVYNSKNHKNNMASETNETREKSLNFLEEIIEESIAGGETRIQTRFPPEPNGYLHIGHAKSICINFGLAKKYGGKCNLRFDDTNPVKEDVEYVDSIKRDIQWLGFQWELERYASDYFDQLYEWAVELIKKGLAYVDDQTQDEIRENRGTVSVPGTPSPWRDRSVEENLDLFTRMKNGEFPDGAKVLRAKIDMAHPNMLFRDPIMYRIIHAEHHRTGDKWCIYPMYDYAHGQSDSIERITHSICTLEFDVHRPLYDWFIQALNIFPSHQYEFARLNLTYTMMSKRKLLKLVQEGAVMGWDDPRMPTICALRRKGYTPASVRNFAEMVGVAKRDNVIDLGKLEYCVREDLNRVAQRRMAVLNPLKVVITNYEDDKTELFTAINNPEDETAGTRQVPFSKVIWIERDDFMENPPKKFFRLSPGGEVRLRYSYLIKCEKVVKDEGGNITELRCTYDPMSGGGSSSDGRRVKGVIHWVSAAETVEAEIRLFNPLFTKEDPDDVDEGQTWEDNLNPESMVKITGYLEPSLRDIPVGQAVQFERVGYFCPDTDSTPGHLVFNRTVTLKDSWAKINK